MKVSKYRNIITEVDGIKFDSKREAKRYGELKLLQKAEIVKKFELQPEFPYLITYSANGKEMQKKAKYIGDFKVYYENGFIVEDIKGGFETEIFKRKRKIIETLYGIKIILK